MKYDFELNLEEGNNLSILLGRIKENSVVLEFGCANGRMTKYMKENLNCKVYGAEIEEAAAKDALPYTEDMYIGDIESFDWCRKFAHIKFDYVVFADVLEHLYDPRGVLERVKEFLKEDGKILVSLPNISYNGVIIDLINNNFQYSKTGLLDETHIRFFTKKSFDELLKECGFGKNFEHAIKLAPMHSEFKNGYETLPFDMGNFLKSTPYGEVYHLLYELTAGKENIQNREDEGFFNFAELYIDSGEGFNAKDTVKQKVNLKEDSFEQSFLFDLSSCKGIKGLRIDPLNYSCIAKVKEVTVKTKTEEIVLESKDISPNSFFENEKGYYFGNDPQIFINFDFSSNIEYMKVCFEYYKTGTPASFEALKELSRFVQKKDALLTQKEQILEQKEQMLKHKDNVINHKNRKINNMNRHIAELNHLAQSLRIRNRVKNIIKRILPKKAVEWIKYLKSHGAFYKRESFLVKKQIKSFKRKPLISVVMPVYNVDPKWLKLAVKSLENQWYKNWELCICDDKSTNEETIKYLKSIKNKKIKIYYSNINQNISIASNEAFKMAKGEYIALMDNDDELSCDAFYEVVKAINEHGAEFIYSDEDKIDMNGVFCEPHFKANYSNEMILSQNYISHLGVIKKEVMEKAGLWRAGFEGAQDYDLYLRVFELTDKIYHIPKILYHWRKIPGSTAASFNDKSYAAEAGRKAIEEALSRRGIKGEVRVGKYAGTYKIDYEIKNDPLVSIVIPFKDKPELLKLCVESIIYESTYENYEIIGISNNSEEAITFNEIERLKALDKRVSFYEYNVPFNYSQINNHAVKEYAKGEHIILLNNDIEIISRDWIEQMLMYSQTEHIGCVGAKLYYPNDTIQHAGVIIGLGGVAGHSHKYFPREGAGYFYRLNIVQNLSAVTAACLMVKKSIYDEVGGLNENDLKIAFNDVDFCLRVQEKGYKNVFTPYCEAYHHESISRGAEDNPEKVARFNSEVEYMKTRHNEILKNGDPYYNVNLTLDRENFSAK